MFCPKCGEETDTLYSTSESMKNAVCPKCAGSGDWVLFVFIITMTTITFLLANQ